MNGRTTYQAKIVKPDGQPLQATSVNFRFSVLDTVGSCVLYVEDYAAVNMNDSGGLISFALGSGTRSFPTSGTSQTFQNVFSNSVTSFSCQAPGIYSPGPNDVRKVVMQFNDGSGWQTLPAMTINAVPYAMYADKANDSRTLNGKADTAFVENSTLAALNCNPATHAITFNGVSFSCIPVGSSSSGITSVTTSGTVLSTGGTASAPVISIQAATVSQDGYLTSLDYAEFKAKLSASSTQIINTLGYTPVSSSAVATQIGNSNLSGDVSGTVSANSVVSVGGKSAAQISASVDDTLAATSSATADTIVKRNSLGHVTVNDLYATAAKVNYVDIYKPSTSFNIRLQAPTSLSANYTLTLPNNTGVSGQVIATDGSGNLSWVNAATGSVTSVSAIAPLASTGGATPTISITQATSSTAGYLSSADWTTFNNKQQATSSAIIATLGYTPADNVSVTALTTTVNNLSSSVGAIVSSQWTTSGTAIHYTSGNVGVGTTAPSAKLHIAAGTSQTAPLKLTSGTLLTSAQSGTMEYDGFNFYLTDSTNARRMIATSDGSGTFDAVAVITNSSNISLVPVGSVVVSSTTASTNSSTGALVVKGGVGVAGNTNVAGAINATGAITSTSYVSGTTLYAGAGTAALPSHTFSTDSATGMWQPTSGAVAFSTAGSERVRVTSAGNVAIGTTSPNTSRLALYSSGAVNNKVLEVTGAGIAGGQTGPFYGIYVDAPANNNATARYGVYAYGTGGGGGSNYGVYGYTTQGSSSRLSAGVAGVVAVNSAAVNNAPTMTTPVAGVLAIASSTGTSMNATTTALLARNETVYGAMSYGAYIDALPGPTSVIPLRIDYNGSELVRVSSSGTVGVGTISPQNKIHINESSANSSVMQFTNSDTGQADGFAGVRVGISSDEYAALVGGTNTNGLRLWTNNIARMTLDNNGNFGFGTVSPTHVVDIVDDGNDASMKLTEFSNSYAADFRIFRARGTKAGPAALQNGDVIGGLQFYGYGAAIAPTQRSAAIEVVAAENYTTTARGADLVFKVAAVSTTSTVEAMRISNNGSVGIGVSAPTAALEVRSKVLVSNATNGSNANMAALNSGATDGGYLHLRRDASNEWYFQADPTANNAFHIRHGNLSSTPDMTILQSGNIGIGTSSPATKLNIGGLGAANATALRIDSQDTYSRDIFISEFNTTSYGGIVRYHSGLDLLSLITMEAGVEKYGVAVARATGYVGIGMNSAAAYPLDVNGDIRISGTPYRNGGDSAWIVPSDARLKDVSGNYNRGLREIANIDTIYFNYKKDNPKQIDSSVKYTGVLAQQVQKQIPEAVKEDKDGFLSLNTTPIFWAMLNAVKELYHQVLDIIKNDETQDRAIASVTEENKIIKAENAKIKQENVEIKAYLCAKDPAAPICK
ncbi:MAG: tail fiber domain-containing protein [Pseudobdellovibrio sp.]|nr:tail fiber domain-containing protein [Pseudobdellovibrio sp.]